MMVDAQEHERQRVKHLVLGKPRPKPTGPGKRSKSAAGLRLAPGIEERVALRERFRGIEGTPETHDHVERERPGALARLCASGAIDLHQLAAAEEIGLAFTRTVAEVAVRTAAWQTRFSIGRRGGLAAIEAVHAASLDLAYTRWRADAAPHAAMLLSIIVDDVGVTIAARRYRMSARRARGILVRALDRWRKV